MLPKRETVAAPMADYNGLLVELVQLERREREVSAFRRKLHDRLASFPNELTQERERQISAERQALHRQIDVLRARVRPLQ
jgi:hypothetical protein